MGWCLPHDQTWLSYIVLLKIKSSCFIKMSLILLLVFVIIWFVSSSAATLIPCASRRFMKTRISRNIEFRRRGCLYYRFWRLWHHTSRTYIPSELSSSSFIAYYAKAFQHSASTTCLCIYFAISILLLTFRYCYRWPLKMPVADYLGATDLISTFIALYCQSSLSFISINVDLILSLSASNIFINTELDE